jgi:hypothetical protein
MHLSAQMKDPKSGKGWAWAGCTFGIVVSLTANVGSEFVRPENAPANWSPNSAAAAFAISWPVIVLIAVEIIARVNWPFGFFWRLNRYVGLVAVAFIAALSSYHHMSVLLASWGEWRPIVVLGPLGVDGLMMISSLGLLAIERNVKQAAEGEERAARGTEASTTDRPPVIEAITEAPVRTPETDTRRGVARERAALDPAAITEAPATAHGSLSEPVPGGGAARGAFGPDLDATAVLEALEELARDGGPSGSKLVAALERRGVAVSLRDAQGILRMLRRSEASEHRDGQASEPASSDQPATAPEPAAAPEPATA